MAADELISNYIKDPKLKEVLAYMGTMYGGKQGCTPAYIHALINVLYINGSSFFNGGGLQLAESLKGVIEANGGAVLNGEEVDYINVEDKNVVYVKTKKVIYILEIFISLLYTPHLL
jgi:Phytoene dehydrogenase and related proteins